MEARRYVGREVCRDFLNEETGQFEWYSGKVMEVWTEDGGILFRVWLQKESDKERATPVARRV